MVAFIAAPRRKRVAPKDGRVAVVAGLAQARDPIREQVLDDQRIVAFRPGGYGENMQHLLQPGGSGRVIAAFHMDREEATFDVEIVIQPADARVDDPGHVL